MSHPSIWSSLLDSSLGINPGLMDPDEQRFARSQGLLSAGADLLSAQPSATPTSPLAPIGIALKSGRQGAMNGIQMYDALLQRNAAKAAAKRKTEFYTKYANAQMSDPKVLTNMFEDAVSHGLTDEAKSISEVLKSMGGQDGFKLDTIQGPNGPQRVRVGPHGPAEVIGGAGPDELTMQRQFTRENQLADDYRSELNKMGYQKLYDQVDAALQNRKAAEAGDGSAQINMIYAFITSMDPTSVVREGELALAKSAAPIFDQAQGLLNKYVKGESVVVAPDLLKKMGDLMERRAAGVERHWGQIRDEYANRGKRWQVDPNAFGAAPTKYGQPQSKPGSAPVQGKGGKSLDQY